MCQCPGPELEVTCHEVEEHPEPTSVAHRRIAVCLALVSHGMQATDAPLGNSKICRSLIRDTERYEIEIL